MLADTGRQGGGVFGMVGEERAAARPSVAGWPTRWRQPPQALCGAARCAAGSDAGRAGDHKLPHPPDTLIHSHRLRPGPLLHPQALRAAEKVFGATVNSKGYKVVTGAGVIQGDGINLDTLKVSHDPPFPPPLRRGAAGVRACTLSVCALEASLRAPWPVSLPPTRAYATLGRRWGPPTLDATAPMHPNTWPCTLGRAASAKATPPRMPSNAPLPPRLPPWPGDPGGGAGGGLQRGQRGVWHGRRTAAKGTRARAHAPFAPGTARRGRCAALGCACRAACRMLHLPTLVRLLGLDLAACITLRPRKPPHHS